MLDISTSKHMAALLRSLFAGRNMLFHCFSQDQHLDVNQHLVVTFFTSFWHIFRFVANTELVLTECILNSWLLFTMLKGCVFQPAFGCANIVYFHQLSGANPNICHSITS